MSWVERLRNLNLPKDTNNHVVEPVFIDGSKFTKTPLLQELARENPWVTISNVTFQTLYDRYNCDIDKVTSHLFNERDDAIIYENSNQNLILLQTVQHYLRTINDLQPKNLYDIYAKCCNLLQTSSTAKSILILDLRSEYFNRYSKYTKELFLQTCAQMAFLNKRCLFPFMDIIVIKDRDVYDCGSIDRECLDACYRLLHANICSSDKILYLFNKTVIKNQIISAHKSSGLLDLELY